MEGSGAAFTVSRRPRRGLRTDGRGYELRNAPKRVGLKHRQMRRGRDGDAPTCSGRRRRKEHHRADARRRQRAPAGRRPKGTRGAWEEEKPGGLKARGRTKGH